MRALKDKLASNKGALATKDNLVKKNTLATKNFLAIAENKDTK